MPLDPDHPYLNRAVMDNNLQMMDVWPSLSRHEHIRPLPKALTRVSEGHLPRPALAMACLILIRKLASQATRVRNQ